MLVQTPRLPRLLCMKGTKLFSLYTYKNGWDAEKRRSYRIPGSTKSAGVIVSGSKFGEIKWNEKFLEEHPELEHFVATRLEDGSIDFKHIEEEVTVTLEDALSAKRLAAGATWTFDNLIVGTPLLNALKRTFGEYNLYRKILSLAYFLNISGNNASTRYESFAETHRLPWPKPMSPSSVSRLFQRITNDKIDKFFRTLNELTHARDGDGANKYWALDSTSISTHSKNLAKAAWGHNKDGDNLPQINVLMVVNQQTGEPIYFRDYAGNVPDIVTVKHYLQEHCRINFESNAVIVADRGYGSPSNIDRFFQNKINFLINLRTSFALCGDLFKECSAKLLNPISYESEIDCHAVTVETEWSYPVNFATDCKKRTPKLKEKVYVHFYYNQEIFNDERKKLTANISDTAKMIKDNKEIPANLAHISEKFLIVERDENNNVISVDTNNAAVNEYLNMKGIRILVSDTVDDAIEAFKAYFDRNEVEYAFNIFKQRLGGSRMRVSTDLALEGKTFVQFVATSIAIMLRKRINSALKKDNSLKLHYDSELVVIDKLDAIEETKFSCGTYFTEVVGGLRKLLNAMDIPIPSEEFENNVFGDEDKLLKNDPIEEELENIYSDQFQLQ